LFLTNLSSREKYIFYLTLTVIFLTLTYKFIFEPLNEKWSQLNSQILAKQIELKRRIQYLQQEEKVKQIYQKYAEKARMSGSEEEEMAVLLSEMEKNSSATKIHIVNIKPRPIKDLSICKKYILEMNCEATMEDYIKFIYNLQKSTQLIRVEKIKLTSQGKDSPLLKARIVISKLLIAD
jgi:O-succinylbenzoate synthase